MLGDENNDVRAIHDARAAQDSDPGTVAPTAKSRTRERLRKQIAGMRASVERTQEVIRENRLGTIQMSARIHAKAREEKARKRRAKDAERKREKRATQITDKRIAALKRATSDPRGDRFIEKLVGREEALARFREALELATVMFGSTRSDALVAQVFTDITGQPMNKRQAQNRRNLVEKLEAQGSPWHRWRS